MQLCVSDGIKDCLPPFPGHAQSFHQANHCLVVRNQNFAFLERQGKMAVPDFKRDFHRFIVVRWKNFQNRFDGGLNFQIPIRRNVQDHAMCESRPRGERDADFASLRRRKPPSHPAALLPGEDEFVFLLCPQVIWISGCLQAIDDGVLPHMISRAPEPGAPSLAFCKGGDFRTLQFCIYGCT